ncbi:hypothetical protein DFJ73DRAFT_827712 [Zopfochytrium polystomum]|nr:hypothetical protein DFJ73DRAFT_827712 [Zopfochytrium polystomum]
MAHGHQSPLLIDPAIEKWFHMKEMTAPYFKFNRRTTTFVLTFAVVVPYALYYGSKKFAGLKLRGLRQGEAIWASETAEK